MNKTIKLYVIIFSVFMVLLGVFQLGKKEVVDWRKNFDIHEKTPFGLYVFDQEISRLFSQKIEKISQSPYNYYTENPKSTIHNILVIEKNLDRESWKKILHEVEKGSDALLITSDCNIAIQEQLQFQLQTELYKDQTQWQLTDEKYPSITLNLTKFPGSEAITDIGSGIAILGKMKTDSLVWTANFIKIKKGKGHVYYHSDPLFLTNYYLLNSNSAPYSEAVFSYLKDQKTLWFVDSEVKTIATSPLSFILKNPALRYAWWLFLAGLVLFAIFGAKRKQRIIPVIEPLKNKSVEFVQSIGNLYLQEGDFQDMMAKKAQYFLHRVKMELLIDTVRLDESFAKKLQLKTGAEEIKIKETLELLKKGMDPYAAVTKEDFKKMTQGLDEIFPNVK
jgi:hypothetical protein